MMVSSSRRRNWLRAMGRRTLLLVAALLLAALGTSLVFVYVSNVDSAGEGQDTQSRVWVAPRMITGGYDRRRQANGDGLFRHPRCLPELGRLG